MNSKPAIEHGVTAPVASFPDHRPSNASVHLPELIFKEQSVVEDDFISVKGVIILEQ